MPENLTHGYKKNHQKRAKNFFLFKKLNQEVKKRAVLFNKQCLGGYFDLSFKTKRDLFFFLKKKSFKKITSVNFVGPDPRLLEIGAK